MEKEYVITLLTSIVAILSAILAFYSQTRVAKLNEKIEYDKRLHEKAKTTALYAEPLGRSAADLQSRIFNIVKLDFLGAYYTRGSERERRYAISNTLFLIAQFMAWTEAARLEIQYISLDADDSTGAFSKAQASIYSTFQTDKFPPLLRIFAGEQRAIGERMLKIADNRFGCIGYGDFLDKGCMQHDPLFSEIYADIISLSNDVDGGAARLVALQHGLVDLINLLDKNGIRFPKDERTKI